MLSISNLSSIAACVVSWAVSCQVGSSFSTHVVSTVLAGVVCCCSCSLQQHFQKVNKVSLVSKGFQQCLLCLKVQPVVAWGLCLTCGLMLMYAIGSPRGTTAFQTTPQGTFILLAATSSVACIAMCLAIPFMSQRLLRRRAPVGIKRMSLVGLVSCKI